MVAGYDTEPRPSACKDGGLSYAAELSAESTEVSRRRQAFKYAEASLKQAEAELDDKREWYRFVLQNPD